MQEQHIEEQAEQASTVVDTHGQSRDASDAQSVDEHQHQLASHVEESPFIDADRQLM